MQALYQLSYSPLLGPPGFPGGDANITGRSGAAPNRFHPVSIRTQMSDSVTVIATTGVHRRAPAALGAWHWWLVVCTVDAPTTLDGTNCTRTASSCFRNPGGGLKP